MKKRGLFAILFGMAVLSFGLFTSCDIDIGLGSAVDVEPPTLYIENPPASKIIRDAFPISGTFSDDGSISAITVELTNTETQVKYPKIDGTWGKENTWSATVDPIKLKIPDGKYEATITIRDNGGHHSVSTRSFIIDNTAPVVVLSRPASDAAESDLNKIESYGQYLTLEGQAADDNDIEKIVIKFYSKDNPDKDPIVKEITSIPPTISLDVAKFMDENDPTYTKLYGTDKNAGEKYYYCTISAFDGAKRYPAKGDEKADDDYGNEESSYILWTDWEKFQSEYSKTTGSSSKIKLPELYSIKAGKSETTQERSVSEKTLISDFFDKAISRGSFKLNPLNNPSYSISGLDIGLANDVENERPLTVQLSKGLDGLSLDTDNMKVYLIPLTIEDDGTETRGKKIYPQQSTYEKKGDGQFITVIQKDNVKDSDGNDTSLVYGTTYVIGVDGEDIEGNKIVPSFDGKEFFIRFKAKNVAPGLTIDEPVASTSYLKKGDKLLIKGTTSVPDGYPTVSITCKKGAETTATTIYTHKVKESDKLKVEGGLIYYNWEFTVPTSGTEGQFFFDQTNTDQYDFDITSNLEELPTTRPITVIYDVVCPTISINSMLPTAEKYTDDEDGTKVPGSYLNGDVTMKVSILDDYKVNTEIKDPNDDKRPYFIIQDSVTGDDISFRVGTETTPTVKHYITKTAMDSFVIHTEDIANTVQARKIKVKIFAQDSAGNLGVDAEDNTKAYFEREYTVDQATDIPVILPYNSSSVTLKYSSMTELDEHLAAKDYKSVLTTGSDLLLSLKDDDGIKKVTFYIGSKDTALAENANPDINQTLQNVPSDYSFQRTLPTVSGRYECKIQVEDTVGKTYEKKFWIIVTGAAPQVTISNTSPDNKIITLSTGAKTSDAKDQFVNTIAIESGYSEFTVTRSEKINGVETPPVVLYGENGTKGTILRGNSFEDIFVPAAGHSENKIKYTVTDEMGHSGEREFVYYTDNAAPVIDADSIKVPSNSQTESVSFRFEATANDPSEGEVNAGYKQSGISKIQYVFENGTASTVPSATVTDKIKTVNGVSSLNETIIFDDEEFNYVFNTEGTKTIYIRAIDDVGNIGAWVAKSFMFDKAKPVVDIVSYTRTGETAKSITSTPKAFDSGKLFTLSGTAEDSQGIKTFQIWQKKEGQEGYGIKIVEIEDKANGNWSIESLPRAENGAVQQETAIQSGKYIYTVVAIDKSEHGAQAAKSTEQTVKVTIDRTAPVLVSTLADGEAFGENSLSGNAYTFRGSLTDDGDSATGSDVVYYAFNTTGTQPSIPFTNFVSVTADKWNIPMNLHTTEPDCNDTHEDISDTLYEGKKYLWIYGTDKAGNATDVTKISFMVDQNKPRVSYEIYKNEETTNPITADNGTIKLNRSHFPELNTNTGFVPKYTLRGTAWDANGIEKVKVYTQRGTASAVLEAEVVPGSDGKWNVSITGEGNNVHTIYAYDKSGNATNVAKVGSPENSCSIIFDTTAPTNVDITDYDDGTAITETATIKRKWLAGEGDNYINGTAKDNESGLAEIRVIVDNPEESDLTKWTKLTLSDEWTYKFTIPSNFTENDDSADSYHSVTVKAVDKAGNETKKTRYFRYDKTLPLANLELNKNDQYVNASDFADITFTGYAHDGISNYREVGSAEITVKKDNVLQSDLKMTLVPVSDHDENFGNFTKSELNAAEFADGKYTFTLDVKDKAGNSPSATSTLTQSMIVDKTKPVITAKGLVVGNAAAVNSIRTNNPKATIQVTFTEDNIDSVYYYVDDLSVANRVTTAANGTIKEAASIADEWIGMSRKSNTGTSYTYEKAHQFSDGKGKVYIKIVDKAGNVTYDISSLSYEVDTKVPDVCTLGNVTVEGTILTGTRLINGTKDVTFTVTATDYDDNYNTAVNPRTKVGNSASKVISVAVKTGGGVKAVTDDFTYTHTTDGVWTIKIPANQLQSGAVSVTVTDTFGNSKDYLSLFTLDLDNKAPSLGSYSLANSYDATATNATSKTFYMNNQNNGFRLEGIAKDDRVNGDDNNGEIEKVELTLTAGSKTETLLSYSSAWTFEMQKATWKDWSGDVTGKIVITDKAKNVTTVDNAFTIKFDNDAPKAVHWADSSNKDIYFRFGNADNDKDENDANKWETGDAVNATNNPNNTDVGKKYSSNSWGNDSTIEIRGTFFETGSGIKTINYAIFNVAPTTSITLSGQNYTLLEALEKGKLKAKTDSTYINAIGTFAPLDIPEERKVPYTAATGRTSEVVKSNFRTSLAGFNGTNNYLVLVAEDYVGNRAVDSLKNTTVTKENGNITAVTEGNTNWNDSMSYYIIKKDTTAPIITAGVTEGAYTNGTGNIKIVCEASDNESEINNVTVKVIDNDNKTVKINGKDETKAEPKSGKYEVSIPASAFTSDTYTVYAKATDNAGAGNSKEVSAGTITVDTEKPTFDTDSIKLTETTGTGDSAQTKTAYKSGSTYYVNNTTEGKTFNISGRAEDNLGVKNVSISVVEKLPDDSTETAKTLSIAPQDTNGSFTFNVSAWSTWTTGATVTLNVTDKAGNTVASSYTMDIEFDTAAPTVVPANIVTPNTTQTESSLFTFRDNGGSISDGTSGPKTIDIAFTTTNTKPSAAQVTGIEVSSTGVWSSTVEFDDSRFGEVFKKTENGKVVDVEGEKYLWIRAYDNAGNVTSGDTEWESTSFKYDKAVPSISFDDQTTPAMNSYNKDAFTIKVNASDTWGVKDIKIYKVTGAGNSKVDTELTNATVSNGDFTFEKGALTDGTYNFKVVVTDKADKTNSVTRSFTVDTTPPAFTANKVKIQDSLTPYENGGKKWYNSKQLPLTVTVSDVTSGMSSVQAYIDSDSGNPVSLVRGSGENSNVWTGNISCTTEGEHTINIVATDIATNTSNTTIPVAIDTTAPQAPIFLGAGTTPASEITSLLVNKESNVTVYAALKDGGESDKQTGIASAAAFVQKVNRVDDMSNYSTPVTISAWAANTAYTAGNFINSDNKLYICTTAHTSATEFDSTKWKLFYNNWSSISSCSIWSYEIQKDDMTTGGINFTVKDAAGNTADYTLFQMVVDTDKPTVSFNDISNLNIERASTDPTVYVNGTITLSGSANDNQKLASLKVEYQKEGTDTWTEIPATTNTSLASWSRTWNTKATGISDEAIYTIRVSATDAAGWPTQTPATKKVKVSQKTDRPVVSFSNVTLGETMNASTPVWLKNTTKIIGTVSDDDGIAANGMEISLGGSTWKPVTLNGSSFSYDLQKFYTAGPTTTEEQANGTKTIYFRVKDAKNTTPFESATTYSLSAVYLTDGTDKYGDSDAGDKAGSILHVKVDTIYPEVILQGAKLADADDYTTAYNTITLGGAKKSFKVKFTAADTNGIGSITGTAEFPYGTGTDKITVSGTGLTEPSDNVSYYTLTFTLSDDQVNQLKASSGYDGAINVRITASDNAGMQTSQTATLAYDYKPSVVGNEIKPVSTTPQSGEVSAYGSVSEAAAIRYIVSPSSTVGANGSVSTWVDGNGVSHDLSSEKTVEAWKDITDATLAWTINFDNSTDTNGTHEKSLNKYLIDYGIAGHENNSTSVDSIVSSFTDYVTLYLWINTIDAAGNEATKVHPIIVDPQGDRPNLQFSYPTTSGGTLGGQVSIYGTATDTKGTNNDKIGVDSVWIQIKSTTHGTDTTDYGTAPSYDVTTDTVSMNLGVADLNYMKAKGYHVYNMKTYNAAQNATNTEWNGTLGTYTDSDGVTQTYLASDYAALATLSGAAWNIDINGSQEFDPPTGTSTNPVAIRVYARDKDKKFSLKAERYVSFDADTPIISDLKVVKSTSANLNADASTNSIVKTYSSGMYIKGTSGWYLTGTVTDKDKIKSLIVNGVNLITFTETDGSDPVISISDTYKDIVAINTTTGDNPITTVTFKYPLTTSADVGTIDFNIVATDGIKGSNAHTTPAERVLIKYDNKSPVLATTTAEGLDIDTSIYQSNKRYKFGSKVNEDPVTIGTVTTKQSGFAYTAFYFTRNNTVTEKDTLFDVLNPRASAAIDITDFTIAVLGSEAPNSADNTIVSDSNLYWYRKTIGSLSGSTVTLNDVTGIRPSSLMKIDGAFYLVTEVNGNSVTVDSPVPSTATVVYAAIAGVVNNTVPEGEGGTMQADGYYSAPSRDDGDRMIESVDEIITGTTWKWSASICSSNMTDGAVTLHYVVFDQAGNYTSKTIDCNVANNAPRLASLKVWSDFNEDGNEQEGEYDTFYYNGKPRFINGTSQTKATELTSELVVSNNKKDYNNDGTAFMTVKAKTRFIPEIVGGNNALYYSYRYKKNKASNWTSVAYGDNSIGNGFVHGIQEEPVLDANDDDYYLQSEDGGGYIKGRTNLYVANYNGTKYYMEIPGEGAANSYSLNGIGNSNSANDPTWFEYTIYDSTDGSATDWKNVENEVVKYNTANRLSAKFRVALNLQYVDNTSPVTVISPLYWKSATDNSVYKDVNDKLYGHVELKSDLGTSELGSTYGTDDDKVSGIVVFRGFAYDNKKLTELKWGLVNNATTYTSPSYKFGSSMKAGATFSNGTWTSTATMDTDHYTFEVSTAAADGAYHNQNGHKVAWTLTLDTSYITGVIAKDLRLIVQATDSASKVSTITNDSATSTANQETDPATYDAGTYRPTYKVDVLPYITGVTTRLAGMNVPDPTAYSRTARGHYPIASNESSIVLSGYNLAANNANVTLNETAISSLTSGSYAYTVSGTDENAISTINNMNNNDAHGSYNLNVTGLAEKTKVENMYNRKPNTNTNLTLTDDVIFDVWEFNNRAAISKGMIKEPMMRINPANNMIGFGFVNDIDSVSFPTNALSYTVMQKNNKDYVGTNFVYDSNGHAHTISIGLDAQAHTGIAGRMNYINSRWVTGSSGGVRQWDKRYAIALESIGIPAGVSIKGNIVPYENGVSLGRIDIERFPNPAITVANHGSTPTVYIMYYDAEHDQIRFRYGVVNNTSANRTDTQYGLLNDSKCEYYIHSSVRNPTNNGNANKQIPDADHNTNSGSDYDNHGMFEAAKDYYALVAGNYYNQRNDSYTGNPTEGADPIIATGNKGSKYYAMDVVAGTAIGDDKVVMIWYDDSASKLMYMYRYGLTAAGDNTDASVNGVANKWSAPKEIFNKKLQDCAIKVDPLGGIHIAAYDQTNADLVYAYLPTYNHLDTTDNTPYTSVVDAYSQVGKYITIDTVLDSTGTKAIPYISYFTEGMSSLPKLAYIPGGIDKTSAETITASLKDGSSSTTNLFTGAWEVTLLPSNSSLQQYKVCVGAFRDASNKTTKPTKTDGTTPTVTSGVVYPNGETDLVVGYSIRDNGISYMETAMRK